MIRNLTPHPVVLARSGPNAENITLPPAGPPPRVAEAATPARRLIDGDTGASMPVYHLATGAVEGLPDEANGVALVVSRMVAAARPDRRDLYFPHDFVRDEQGRIVGCRALGQVPPCAS